MMMIEPGKHLNTRNPGSIPPKPKRLKTGPAPGSTGVGRKILIVEDELLIAENMKELIEEAGFIVVGIYSSAEDALRHVARLKPDLIIMDVRLRGTLDGIQAARIIQQKLFQYSF
jgi:PleD family two-component response regulator